MYIVPTSSCKNPKPTQRRLAIEVAESQRDIMCEIDSIPCSNSSALRPKPPKAGEIEISAQGKFLLTLMR